MNLINIVLVSAAASVVHVASLSSHPGHNEGHLHNKGHLHNEGHVHNSEGHSHRGRHFQHHRDPHGGTQISKEVEDRFLRAFDLTKSRLKKHRRDPVEIPDFMLTQYTMQTGLDVSTANFRKGGVHAAYADTLVTHRCVLCC